MLMNVVDAVIRAVEEQMHLASVLARLPHEQLHLVDPNVARQLRVTAASYRRTAVWDRRILAGGQPEERIVRVTAQAQFLELGRRSLRDQRAAREDRVLKFRPAILGAEFGGHAELGR